MRRSALENVCRHVVLREGNEGLGVESECGTTLHGITDADRIRFVSKKVVFPPRGVGSIAVCSNNRISICERKECDPGPKSGKRHYMQQSRQKDARCRDGEIVFVRSLAREYRCRRGKDEHRKRSKRQDTKSRAGWMRKPEEQAADGSAVHSVVIWNRFRVPPRGVLHCHACCCVIHLETNDITK